MKKKNIIIIISSCALAWIGLLIVASFLDLQINIAVQNKNSLYGQFFAEIGEIPAYVVAPIAGIIFFQAVTNENRFYVGLKVLSAVICFAGFFVFYIYLFGKFVKDDLMYKYVYMAVFSLVSVGLGLLGTMKVDKALMKKLVVFAIFILVVLAMAQILTTVMKLLWGRMRFRNMNANYDGFTPWYILNLKPDAAREALIAAGSPKVDDAFKSFPSGHTSAAGTSFVVIMLPEMFEKLKKYKVWFYVVPAVYTALVAFSRLIVLAHFLSDVLFGYLIAVVSVFCMKALVNKLNSKYGQRINNFFCVSQE